MKMSVRRLFAAAAVCSLMMMMGACSSSDSSTAENTDSTETAGVSDTTDTTQNSTAKDTNDSADTTRESSEFADSTSSSEESESVLSLSEAGSRLQAAFKDQGYTIYDIESEADEYSFKISNDNGASEVDIQKYLSKEQAQMEYQDEINVFDDEDFFVQDTYTSSLGEYSTLRNSINYIWGIEAVDTVNNLTYSIEEIPIANIDTVQAALTAIGFTM